MSGIQPTLTDNGYFSNIQITNHDPEQITSPSDLVIGRFYRHWRIGPDGRKIPNSLPEQVLSIDPDNRKFTVRRFIPDGGSFTTDCFMCDSGLTPYKDDRPERRWNATNYMTPTDDPTSE